MLTGLTSAEVQKLLQEKGFNEIPEKKKTLVSKIVHNFLSPISLMLILAAVLSFAIGKFFDGNFILVLLVLNISITLWQEGKADSAIAKLNEHLSQDVKVLREGKWIKMNARMLVPGDIIQLVSGEVVPADGKVLEVNNSTINDSAVTGESLPKDQKVGDTVFSGAFYVTGVTTIQVTATGKETRFGKTLTSVEKVRKKSLLEKDIINISRFLTVFSVLAVIILSVVFYLQHTPILQLLTIDLSLVIAGIPISLPTVMTLIIEFGVIDLAKKDVIVRRLSALEDLANVSYLLTDKTGTLTENKITVQEIFAFGEFKDKDVVMFAQYPSQQDPENPIDQAIIEKSNQFQLEHQDYSVKKFIPADSTRKHSTTTIQQADNTITIAFGAPQVIEPLCSVASSELQQMENKVQDLAKDGFRTLAVAVSQNSEEKDMKLIGLLALSDTLRSDAKSVITFMEQNGIGVSMVTGDNRAIAGHIANQLDLSNGKVISKEEIDQTQHFTRDFYNSTGAFAEVLPGDKFKLVEKAKQFFVVASNGDGVNDLPAVKVANVGIAVKNAVMVLKSTADIVLLSDGIGVIKDAIIESRKIFERIYTYSLYRISESLRLIVTIAILGILYKVYPLTPLQIIVLVFLNDIPIISLASDRVHIANRPAKINAKSRFTLSSLYGLTGIAESLVLFFVAKDMLHLDWNTIQTMFFLKLTVSGHMLIYVAHTKLRWFQFLPSKQVILATTITQLIATTLALTGFLMPTGISLTAVLFVWAWSLLWMQAGEGAKVLFQTFAHDS